MKKIIAIVVSVILGVLAALGYSRSTNSLIQVQIFFGNYVKYQSTNDPRIADLVDDSAVIRHIRYDGIGEGKKVSISGARFKELVNIGRGAGRAVPKMTYSEVVYTPETQSEKTERFRISGKREAPSGSSLVKLPFHLVVGKDSQGQWKIYEEQTESSLVGQPTVP